MAGFIETILVNFLETWGPSKEKLTSRLKIMERDGFRCQVPGCSCRRFLEVHHIVYRSHGGSNEGWNLITLCGFHHRQCLHNGYIIIKGEALDNVSIVLGPAAIQRSNPGSASFSGETLPFASFHNGIRLDNDALQSATDAA